MSKGPGVAGWIAIGLGIFAVVVAAIVAAMALVVFGALRASDPYKDALKKAQSDPRVIAALGSPVEPGIWVNGKIDVNIDDDGTARLDIHLKGPKQKGDLRVEGTKTRGRWYYQRMVVTPARGGEIDLLK
ncbi:MAG TPA: cytochrome c oxidase assembly factor Coa1 family protein [Thermoanaerobaculia bacterium]|jgi:hypothetical protein